MADTLVDYKRGFMSMEVQRIKEKQIQRVDFKGTYRGKNNKIQGARSATNKVSAGTNTLSDMVTKQLRADHPQDNINGGSGTKK
jgi:hypothetical protein